MENALASHSANVSAFSPVVAHKKPHRFSNEEKDKLKLIYPSSKDFAALNAYRELRTNLFKRAGDSNFTLMLTSPASGSGTTHVTMNLACSIALDPSKTALVIDCNIHNPRLSEYTKESIHLGLTDYLNAQDVDLQDIIYPTGLSRIKIIPTGGSTIGAAESFSSSKMAELIAELKTRYPDRYILIDAPPVNLSVESQIISSCCDMAMLVVKNGVSNPTEIDTAADTLASSNYVGLVFNEG